MNEMNPESLCGILVVDKPLQWSSMDVIRRIRQSTGQRKLKAGHAGTLDPLATGVLVCCIGKATKLVDKLMGQPKVYEAQIDLTAFTSTDDREGQRQEVEVAQPPTLEEVRAALGRFVGEIQQRPPMFSAIHIEGKRAYNLARAGQAVEMPSRTVTVHDITLQSYSWPVAQVSIHCGKGTYIRSIARDLGLALQTGGHLASLRRTCVGQFDVSSAMPGEALREKRITQADLIPIEAVQGIDSLG